MDFLFSGFNILLMILGFGLLIFVHELGHFVAAKWANIRTEAFAIGMGPVLCAWRKNVGFRLGSTERDVMKKVQEYCEGTGTHLNETTMSDEQRRNHVYRAMDVLGIGETEYSLRALPIGGFVKMLGQEDANPKATSNDPRSYNRCPVGKRMIVVSAGVVMNIILAVILFVIAFMVGVKYEAPIIGYVSPTMPASKVLPANAEGLGISDPGLQPGDVVTHIDGDVVRTFADIQIACAMSKPDEALSFRISREGFDRPLKFTIEPKVDQDAGLRSIGVADASSTRLSKSFDNDLLQRIFEKTQLDQQGVKPGMRILTANGRDVEIYEEVEAIASESGGVALTTTWGGLGPDGSSHHEVVTATVDVRPELQVYRQLNDSKTAPDSGVLGLSPLVRVTAPAQDSPNADKFKQGDLIIRVGDTSYPRRMQLQEVLKACKEVKQKDIEVVVRRGGEDLKVQCTLNRDWRLGIGIEAAMDVMTIAQPTFEYARRDADNPTEAIAYETAAVLLKPLPGTTIRAIDGEPVSDWRAFREHIQQVITQTNGDGSAQMALTIQHPTQGSPVEDVLVTIPPDEAQQIAELTWTSSLYSDLFEPQYVTLTADGNPLRAVSMGIEQTHKLIVMTYLTIDRLFRRSVKVDQLRGPVGIVHIGTKVADRGFMYLIFFLAMISVNLAVINFLPLPIVDGGLFLFLIYEKLKGRPPSLGFQNAATIVGLCLIGTIFLVTFYNDIVRLVSGGI